MFDRMFRQYDVELEEIPDNKIKSNKEKIMRLAEEDGARVKKRRVPKKAVIIPAAAAAVIAAGAFTAGAVGFDIFGMLNSQSAYGSSAAEQQSSAVFDISGEETKETADTSAPPDAPEESSAPAQEYAGVPLPDDKNITPISNMTAKGNDCTVTLRGITGDKHSVTLYYDVTYTNDKFFKDGQFIENGYCPYAVSIGSETVTGINGNTVTYVGTSIITHTSMSGVGVYYDALNKQYIADVEIQFINSESEFYGGCKFRPRFNKVAEQKKIKPCTEITLPNGEVYEVYKADIGPYSLSFDMHGETDLSLTDPTQMKFYETGLKINLKDGSVIKQPEKTQSCVHSGCEFVTIYTQYIDPEQIASIEFFGTVIEVG